MTDDTVLEQLDGLDEDEREVADARRVVIERRAREVIEGTAALEDWSSVYDRLDQRLASASKEQ